MFQCPFRMHRWTLPDELPVHRIIFRVQKTNKHKFHVFCSKLCWALCIIHANCTLALGHVFFIMYLLLGICSTNSDFLHPDRHTHHPLAQTHQPQVTLFLFGAIVVQPRFRNTDALQLIQAQELSNRGKCNSSICFEGILCMVSLKYC